MEERLIRAEEKVASAHKRLDNHHHEIAEVKTYIHKQALITESHNTILNGITDSVDKLTTSVESFSTKVNKVVWMVAGGTLVGSGFVTFLYFIGKDLFRIW